MTQDALGNLTLGDDDDDGDDSSTDPTLQQTVGESTASATDDNAASTNNSHDEDAISLSHQHEGESTCVICLEAFYVGERVSWSHVSRECSHVFHKGCIEHWLVDRKHDDCPSCRSILLKNNISACSSSSSSPISGHDDDDNDEGQKDQADDSSYDDNDADAGSSMFVIMHGLVSRATRRASYPFIGQSVTDDKDECPPDVENPTAKLPPTHPR
jgi:hypothetical protein